MHPFLSFLVRTAVTVPSMVAIWLISFFAVNNPFWLSSGISLTGGALIYGFVSFYTNTRFLKRNGLSRKEYRSIKKNLDEAKPKIARLQKSLFSIRHLPSLKERVELVRVVRKIYSLTKKEPKRFYLAERFYFSHLDSILELTEKYSFLSSQPKRNRELEQSLYDTRETLSEMGKLVEQDLYHMLENDLDDLNFEIDVAKYSIKTVTDSRTELSGLGKVNKDKKEGSEIPQNKNHSMFDPKPDEFKNEGKKAEPKGESKQTGPRYFIHTKVDDKEEMKIPLNTTRESRYKDKHRRFPE